MKLHLEGTEVRIEETLVGATRRVFIGLKPGQYRLVVSGKAEARMLSDEALCDVFPGQTVKTELRLPFVKPRMAPGVTDGN